MAFIDTFDPSLPLEDQVEFPLEREGVVMRLNPKQRKQRFSVRLPNTEQFSIENVKFAQYTALLLVDGCVSIEEIIGKVYQETYNRKTSNAISMFDKKRLRGFVKSRPVSLYDGSPLSIRYLGNLDMSYRVEKEIQSHGIRLNLFTGCAQTLANPLTILTGTEMKYLELLLQKNFLSFEEFHTELPESMDTHVISKLRKVLGKNVIKGSAAQGYWIGNLRDHRKEHEIQEKGVVLNTFTGYAKSPRGSEHQLERMEAKYLEHLIKENCISVEELANRYHGRDVEFTQGKMAKLRKKLSKSTIRARNSYRVSKDRTAMPSQSYHLGELGPEARKDLEIRGYGLVCNPLTGWVKLPSQEFVQLYPLETGYLEILMKEGFVSDDRLYSTFHDGYVDPSNIKTRICNIGKKIGKGFIKRKRGVLIDNEDSLLELPGGYWMGDDIAQHKPEHVIEKDGFFCNPETGYVKAPNGEVRTLKPVPLFLLGKVMEGRGSLDLLTVSLYSTIGEKDKDKVAVHLSNLNRALGGNYVQNTGSWGNAFYELIPNPNLRMRPE